MAAPFAEGGRTPKTPLRSLRARLCPAAPRLLLAAGLAVLYIPAKAATLASGYPKVQNGLFNGSDGTGAGSAAVLDPVTQQLWAAGSANDPSAAAPTGVVVLEDGKGNVQTSIGLRLGSNGSSCTVGSFNYCASGSSSTVNALALDAVSCPPEVRRLLTC